MTMSKEEGKLQKELLDKKKGWPFHYKDVYISKTHEMLSSGKPDLRVSCPSFGQLDIELKHKTTGPRGLNTGVTALQEITINNMNAAGMPAVALVWSQTELLWFLTLDEVIDPRERPIVHWIKPVYNRVPLLESVYRHAKELLNERGYPSAAHLPKIDW